MYNPLFLPVVQEMLENNDTQAMAEFCNVLHPAVIAEVLETLESDQIWRILTTCSFQKQVEIFEYISLSHQAELVEVIDRESLSHLLEEMSPDDRVALISRMEPSYVSTLMPLIAQAERNDIRKMLSYPEDSAGSIMTTEYAWLSETVTVNEAIEQLRLQAPSRETIYYIYILDEGRRLQGMISLQELILANPDTLVKKHVKREVIAVRVDDDQEFVAHELAKYDFLAIPVVDNQNRLVGIVTYDDVIDIVQEEATEDAYRAAGVEPFEDHYLDISLKTVLWKRGSWLFFFAAVALISGKFLHSYSSIYDQVTWTVFFLPLVMASGGNAGTQACTLVIRAMTLGEINPSKYWVLVRRELLMGALLGLWISLLGIASAIFIFKLSYRDSLVVFTTVFMVVYLGNIIGVLLPMAFKKLGMDPALMSNPMITAIIDVVGVLLYLGAIVLIATQVVG
jgi:magnesium transporter